MDCAHTWNWESSVTLLKWLPEAGAVMGPGLSRSKLNVMTLEVFQLGCVFTTPLAPQVLDSGWKIFTIDLVSPSFCLSQVLAPPSAWLLPSVNSKVMLSTQAKSGTKGFNSKEVGNFYLFSSCFRCSPGRQFLIPLGPLLPTETSKALSAHSALLTHAFYMVHSCTTVVLQWRPNF